MSDTGVGIDKVNLSKIFELYYQAPVSQKSGNPGTGIGLYMLKQLVELHGGTIRVESELGKGSQFLVTIPVQPNSGKFEQAGSHQISDFETSVSSEIIGKTDEIYPEKQYKILIVDDNDDIRLFIRSELENIYVVVEASNGNQGFLMAVEMNPDMILSDVMMPEMNGYELCMKLKGDIKTSHIPVILLTAKSSDESQLTGYHSGADDYLIKPFNAEILKIKLQKIIETRKMNHRHFTQTPDTIPEQIKECNPVESKLLEKLIATIQKNLDNTDLDVNYLASELGLSRTILYEKIQATTGQPVADYIRTFRLNEASKLLKEKQYTISEIAYRVGYKSLSHFTTSFKKHYAVTPSEFLGK